MTCYYVYSGLLGNKHTFYSHFVDPSDLFISIHHDCFADSQVITWPNQYSMLVILPWKILLNTRYVKSFTCVHTFATHTCPSKSPLSSRLKRTGVRLSIKISPYQERDSHYKDKTVSRPSYLYNRNPMYGKTVFIMWQTPGIYESLWYQALCLHVPYYMHMLLSVSVLYNQFVVYACIYHNEYYLFILVIQGFSLAPVQSSICLGASEGIFKDMGRPIL